MIRRSLWLQKGGAIGSVAALFLSACSGSGADGESLETTSAPLTITGVSFQTVLQPRFVGAQNNGGGAVIATATVAQGWEMFSLEDINGGSLESGDSVFIRAGNGQYFQAQNGGGSSLNAASNNTQAWETFKVVKQSGSGTIHNGDIVGLQTTTGNWVSAQNGGGGTVFAYGAALGPWEQLQISGLPTTTTPPSGIVTGTSYTITGRGSNRCVDITDHGTADGTAMQQWDCSGGENQIFRVDAAGSGVVNLVNPQTGKCIDVAAAGTTDGTAVQLYTCNGTGAQTWALEDVGNGAVRVRNPTSGKCLDVTGQSTLNGAKLEIRTCSGADNQSFIFGGTGGTGGGDTGNCPPSWTTTAECGGVVAGAPNLGANVIIFDPSMSASSIQSKLNTIYTQMDANQFGTQRYALLFKPGTYSADVKVGFYTQVLGLGQSPDSVTINGAVRAKADWLGDQNATCNFWRGAENFKVVPQSSIDGGKNIWAVSQGTEMRRVHVAGNINLDDGGWSSGGFIVDSKIDGTINSGSQQQFLTRNNDQNWTGRNWNMVFVGNGTVPSGTWPGTPYSVQATTPVVREKPFLYVDAAGNYLVMVPSLKKNSKGRSWADGAPPGVAQSISRFYIANPSDTAATINAALASGKNILFTPGIYHLTSSLQVNNPNTILLGLGLATLSAESGNTLINVADVDNVTLAGLLLEAGPTNSPTLLQVGPPGSNADHSAHPTLLSDMLCRVGGNHVGRATSCFTINSDDVILDNLWLWRADHAQDATGWTTNPSDNGITVNGDDVTAYGLFVEHFEKYQTLWNGNGGTTFFYQSELPYDVPNQSSWIAPTGHNGYASYKVADGVTSHRALGLGVYSVFTNYVTEDNAIEAPASATMNHMVSVSLASGQILHIYNGTGGTVGNGTQTAFSSF
ncbi:Endo-1,4-beta-xylanase A precursor [Minicystis rosea]|nr:Endo-1,4-beta-xylanase A precursor [Minicystis rosea]